MRVPWTARISNQSILKEIIPACVLEGPMLKLKLQYFGHLVPRVDSFEETLMLGKIEGRRRGRQMMRWLDGWHHQLNGHEFEQALGVDDGQEILMFCSPWGSQKVSSVQFSSVAQSCLTLCNPMDCSTPGLPVYHQLLEFTQMHVH